MKHGLEWASWEHYKVGQPGPRLVDPNLAHPSPPLYHIYKETHIEVILYIDSMLVYINR